MRLPTLGLGIGWRPELAWWIERRRDLGFVELLAEDFEPAASLPDAVVRLLERGVTAIPHGVAMGLGGAEHPDPRRLKHLADLVRRTGAPLCSEHLAFVRAGGLESGHLLPVERTAAALRIVVENVKRAQDALPVPLALENISTLLEWPGPEFAEAEFVAEVADRAGVPLLLDVANLHANAKNRGGDPAAWFDVLPLDRIAYVHMAGGVEREGVYHDTHTARTPDGALNLLAELARRTALRGVLLERDGGFPSDDELTAEVDAIAAAWGGPR